MRNFPGWSEGAILESLTLPPLTLDCLKAYARVSGDDAEAHVDPEAARAMGFPNAFAHGLLSMAWLGRLLSGQVPVDRIRTFSVRFTAPVFVGDTLICSGVVGRCEQHGAERLIHLDLKVVDGQGTLKLTGTAVVTAQTPD